MNEIGWDNDNVLPLVRTSMKMEDLMDLDSAIVFDGTDQARLILSDTLYSFSNPLDSLVNIEIAPFERAATLSSLEISDQTAVDTIGMVELLDAAGITTPGDSASLPAFFVSLMPPINIDPQDVDFSTFLDEAVLLTGFLDLEIDNHLPLILETATLTISNTVGGQVLYTSNLTDIQPYTTFSQTEDIAASLAGQPIEGNLTISITNVTLGVPVGLDPIPIYFADYLAFSATIRDLSVSSATAIFPEQNVIDELSDVPLLGLDDMELIYAHVDTGIITVTGFSTIETPLNMHYSIPSATKGLDTFFFDAVVPAADSLNPTVYQESFTFVGYDLDLTGSTGTGFNTFINHTIGTIDSTGQKLSLSLSDTLFVLIEVTKFKPDYITGYLGQDTISIGPDGLSAEIDGLDIRTIDLEDAMLDIVISNGLGIDGDITINTLRAGVVNSTVQGSIHTINPAIDNVTHSTPVVSQFSIPDITDLINSNPDSLTYEFTFEINPAGNVPVYSDFMHNNAGLSVIADIDVPFSFGHTSFSYTTAQDWDFEEEIPQEINSGHLILKADNGLPLSAGVTLIFSDSTLGVLDSLTSIEIVEPAIVDGNGIVSESVISELYFELPASKIQALKDANELLIQVDIEVPDGNGYLEFYADYTLDLTLIGEFNLSVSGEL